MNAVVAESINTATAPAIESMFVTVPETVVNLKNGTSFTAPTFTIARYLTSTDESGAAVISASLKPCVDITYFDSIDAAGAAGMEVITDRQYLALATNIYGVAANWTSGVVGEGKLKQGLRKGTVDEAQAGDYVSPDPDEDRWFTLSNGERVCDAAGNAFTWVRKTDGDARGLMTGPITDDSISLQAAPHGSVEKGIGWLLPVGWGGSGRALIRGGCWGGRDYAGVFVLSLANPGDAYGDVSFRSTKPDF